MIEELKEKCEALAIRKREELELSLERDEVGEPITTTLLVSLAVSAAVSAAGGPLTRAKEKQNAGR